MATYRFPRMLTLLAWEEELRHGPYASEWTWAEITSGDPLTLDFSRVEFADFGALARALLHLDAAVKSGIPATVVLPDTTVITASEAGDSEAAQAARQARTRGDALAFMRQVGFVDSLRAPHWKQGAVRVLDRSLTTPADTGATALASGPDSDRAPYRRRRVFPLRWLEPMPAAQLRESDSFVAVSVGLEDLGLSQSDARTLSQTVLTELVENVAEHGRVGDRPAMALVGAILLTAETYSLRQNGIHPHMAELAERALADHSQILRLIVADSGADLAASLEPERARNGTDWDLDTDRRRQETILHALGNRPAGAAPDTGGPRGATGLWWVARVVRSYHGAVQARTADLLAARLFGRKADGTNIALAGLGHVPGTLLELTLPTGAAPRRSRTHSGGHQIPGTAPNLEMVTCAFDPKRGLKNDDRARLTEQLRVGRADRSTDGLIIVVSLHDDANSEINNHWRRAIYQILEFASSIAHAGMVVVVIPDAQPQLLDPCVAAFNEDLATVSGADGHEPILVLGSRGDPAWCGGSAPLREVLSTLSEDYGALEVTEAFQLWQEVGGNRARFPEILLASGHLLVANTGRLQLRLSLSVVQTTIERAVSRSLAQAVEQGGPGVERGVFRGPTLRVTNRYMSVEPLLTGAASIQLAAFVLARKTEAVLRASAEVAAPTAIVQVTPPRVLVRHLSECLALGGRFYPQPSELNIGEPLVGEQAPDGSKVVLCTDLISTGNTIRRAVAMVAARGGNPIAIACAVDARDSPGPIRMPNRVIPVVSLTEVKVRLENLEGQHPTDIDPLMLRPEDPVPADPAAAAEADLISWFADDPDALRLGHIDDPPRRHYSAFIRLQALRPRERRDQITDAVLSNVRQILADVRVQDGLEMSSRAPVAIWYVSSDGNAERLSGVVRDHLIADGAQIDPPTAVPRWPAGDAWAFPASLGDVARGAGVLIIHWWAITGSTLLQLVRLAARSGASWIAALCMLNQLEDNDADTLRMLRTVTGPGQLPDTGERETVGAPLAQVPVAIRFVAKSSITAFDAHDCPMCVTRERYRLSDETVPQRLVGHAERLRDMLRPRQLDEVSRDSAIDLFTVPVTGAETVDYVRWRGLLLRALRLVPSRQEVIERLRNLTGESPAQREWTSVGLIRLLAAEQQWLRLPPLHFGVAAELLSDICVRSFERVTVSPWLRAQFLMVLSATRPDRLVELLPDLMALAGNEAVLLDQMLLDCCRLLLRSPGDLPIDLAQLRRSLLACRDYLEDRSAEVGATSADEHLYVIRNLLTIADYRSLTAPQEPQAAWDRLREDLARPVIRHRLEAELLIVRSFVEDCEWVEPSPDAVRTALTDWDTCARQLEQRALVNLPPLRDILDGDFVSDQLGHRDQRRLLSLARPGVGELRAVTEQLHALTGGPWRPADPSWLAGQRELLDRINWWNRIFLAAHVGDQERPALLVELIDSAPRELVPCVAELLAGHQPEATVRTPGLDKVKVFCPEKLLDQILTHLLDNIGRHRAPDAGAPSRLEIEYQARDQDTVQMVVRNSGTRPNGRPGRGLRALNEKLGPFGGSLSSQALPEDDPGGWTFAVTVALPLWHGG